MTRKQILDELNNLTIEERLTILEATLSTIRENLQQKRERQDDRKKILTEAAGVLLKDYNTDKELTA